MTFGEQAAADLRNLIADAPVEFTFDGLVFVGASSGKNFRKTIELGGFDEQPEITLVVALKTPERANVFAQAPAVGDTVTVGSHRYTIDRTELDEFSESLQMDLRSPNK